MTYYKILIFGYQLASLGFLLTVLILMLIPTSFGDESWISSLRALSKEKTCGGKDKNKIFFGKPCNFTLYDNTSYAEAWRLADRQNYQEGAKLFKKWVQVDRCDKSDEWRQEVCDGWSLNLLACIPINPNDTSNATCGCLQTKLTEFEVVVPENAKLRTLCRVKKGKKCSQETLSLHCAGKRKCEANICSGNFTLCSPPKFYQVFIVICLVLMNYFQRNNVNKSS